MTVGELKKVLRNIPNECEVLCEVFDKTEIIPQIRVRIEKAEVEKNTEIKPLVNPRFDGEKSLTLKLTKGKSF